MSYDVTSWFIDQTLAKISSPVRKFSIGSSDYSGRVLRWPSLRRSWNDIRPTNISIDLANEDQGLNFFKTDKTHLRDACDVQVGYTHPTSGDELITVFSGKVSRVKWSKGLLNIYLQDKIKDFSEAVVGTSDVPVTFTDTDYLPSEIAWTIATCYGGLVDSRDAANADIDYASFSTWAEIWSSDNVYLKASFDGIKVNDIMRRLGVMTHSAIFVENNKLGFFRFTVASSFETLLDDSSISGLSLVVDDTEIVNKQWVYADYSVGSDYHTIATFAEEASSVNSFGAREEIIKDKSMWYISSATAQNLAQRVIDIQQAPYERYEIESTLVPLARQIGETIRLVDAFLGVDSSTVFRVMEYDINLDRGSSKLIVDGSQVYKDFILDDDIYGLLDQSYNRLL